jgi:hypothetical protein
LETLKVSQRPSSPEYKQPFESPPSSDVKHISEASNDGQQKVRRRRCRRRRPRPYPLSQRPWDFRRVECDFLLPPESQHTSGSSKNRRHRPPPPPSPQGNNRRKY